MPISQLVETSSVPGATSKHYLREVLLPEPVKTSRNMAYYRPETVNQIAVIKRLQEVGIDPTPGRGPKATADFINAELAKWAPIIKEAGVVVEAN